MDPQDRQLLMEVHGMCSRVEGRLDEIKDSHGRDIRAVHSRIDEVKDDLVTRISAVDGRITTIDSRVTTVDGKIGARRPLLAAGSISAALTVAIEGAKKWLGI